MIFRVFQSLGGEGLVVREVNVPDTEIQEIFVNGDSTVEDVLERVFYWGQNDHQPVPDRISVSVSHIIELHYDAYRGFAGTRGRCYMVLPMGFSSLEDIPIFGLQIH